jgi:hypothetical protein
MLAVIISRSARASWVEISRFGDDDGARPCPYKANTVDLLHNYRLHIWLKEIQIDGLIVAVASTLFVLLTR